MASDDRESDHKSKLPFKHNVVNGVPVPSFLDQQRMDEVKDDFCLRVGDLFIASYPKSGTSWTRQIVKLILNNGEDDGKSLESIPWLSAIGRYGPHPRPDLATVAAAMPSPRAFFEHAPYDMMPGGLPSASPAKYIYVSRNPKDVMVSFYYHHLSGKGRFDFSGTWDIFFNLFLTGKVCFGSWFDHVLEWWKHKDDPNVLFLKYEDMKKDHPGAVRAIAEFMGCDLTPDVVDKIVKESTINRMKANPNTNFSWFPATVYALKEINPFVRKGIVGDWKNHFTAEQSALFDAVYQKKMKGTGLNFEFELMD